MLKYFLFFPLILSLGAPQTYEYAVPELSAGNGQYLPFLQRGLDQINGRKVRKVEIVISL